MKSNQNTLTVLNDSDFKFPNFSYNIIADRSQNEKDTEVEEQDNYDDVQITLNLNEENYQQNQNQNINDHQIPTPCEEYKQQFKTYQNELVESQQPQQQNLISNNNISTQCSSNSGNKTHIQSSQKTENKSNNVIHPNYLQQFLTKEEQEQQYNLYHQLNLESFAERIDSIQQHFDQNTSQSNQKQQGYFEKMDYLVSQLKGKNINKQDFKKDNKLLLKIQLANSDFSYQNKQCNMSKPMDKNIIQELMFECLCGKRYKQQSILLNHQKIAHQVKDYFWLYQSMIPSRTGRGSCFEVYKQEYLNMFKEDLLLQQKNKYQIEFQNYNYYIDELINYIKDKY
ncbi:hypothetical protein ABPG72_013143 [Tetrahymena utriculariae]